MQKSGVNPVPGSDPDYDPDPAENVINSSITSDMSITFSDNLLKC